MNIDFSALAFLTTPARDLPTGFAIGLCVWVFIVGSTIGSFLNVVIGRMPEGESVVSPRSRCPKCRTQIAWYDNFPILSWLILRGKCRTCQTPISPRYLFIELLVGLLAVAIVLRFGISLRGVELFFVTCVLVSIAFIDLDTWTIPIPLLVWAALIPLVAGGLGFVWPHAIAATLDYGAHDASEALTNRLIGGFGGLAFLGAMVVLSTAWARKVGRISQDETALGWGDPMLFGAIGFVVGWQLMPIVLLLASVQGIMAYPLAKYVRPDSEETIENSTDVDDKSEAEPNDSRENTAKKNLGDSVESTDQSEEEEWDPPESAIAWGPFLALAGLEVAFFAEHMLRWMREWMMIAP